MLRVAAAVKVIVTWKMKWIQTLKSKLRWWVSHYAPTAGWRLVMPCWSESPLKCCCLLVTLGLLHHHTWIIKLAYSLWGRRFFFFFFFFYGSIFYLMSLFFPSLFFFFLKQVSTRAFNFMEKAHPNKIPLDTFVWELNVRVLNPTRINTQTHGTVIRQCELIMAQVSTAEGLNGVNPLKSQSARQLKFMLTWKKKNRFVSQIV